MGASSSSTTTTLEAERAALEVERCWCANLTIMETDIDRIGWDAEIFTHQPEFKDGYLILPDRPGWGTEPIEAAHSPGDASPR